MIATIEREVQRAQSLVREASDVTDPRLKAKARHTMLALEYKSLGIDANVDSKGRLTAFMKGRDSSSLFVFVTHGDEVEVDGWNGEGGPFEGKISGGFLHGRASADMMGGTAAAAQTMIAVKTDGPIPPCDTKHWSTDDEETKNESIIELAQNAALEGYKRIAFLVPEPTNMEYAGYGHKGQIAKRVRRSGKGGHAANPDKVPNPVISIARFILDIEETHEEWRKYNDEEFGAPTISPSQLIGRENPPVNKIAENAGVTIDARTIPGFHDTANKTIVELAQKHEVELIPDADIAAFKANPDSNLIQALKEASGGKISAQIFPAVSDAGPLVHSLPKDIQEIVEVAIIGPGELHGNAHSDQEKVPTEQIHQAFLAYRRAYYLWAA